jgi:pyrroline-5-carboxylate reductase
MIGNLGTPILQSLINAPPNSLRGITQFIACVQSESSEARLKTLFSQNGNIRILQNDNVTAIKDSDVIILGVDPSQVEAILKNDGIKEALRGRLLISIVAGWSRPALESLVDAETVAHEGVETPVEKRTWVLRTLPNVAALVSQSLTAIEHHPSPSFPPHYSDLATAIFSRIGKSLPIPPSLMPATTAVSGSTPAFWAIIVDSLIDAAVAVGVPRKLAQEQIYQSMRGSAEMLQSGIQPGELRDMGTSPEGCTIAGVMVLEEGGVRGVLGRALRESVTVARAMGKVGEGEEVHVNDTRKI